ncbi:hypothetical protein FACS1894159_06070 [Bacteroidia bacterium]|nr:hypothetical protein FACS1894159_06070 [Bacteroidia bacterium]
MLFLLPLILAGCKNDNSATDPSISFATPVAPANNETIVVNEGETYPFQWSDPAGKGQVIVFSDNAKLSRNRYFMSVGETGRYEFSAEEISRVASNFGAEVDQPLDLYWGVIPVAYTQSTPEEIRRLTITVSMIVMLYQPAGTTVDLNDATNFSSLEFRWRQTGIAAGDRVSLVFKTSPTSQTPSAVVSVGDNTGSHTLSSNQLMNILTELGLDDGQPQQIYWNVRNQRTSADITPVPIGFTIVAKTLPVVLLSPSKTTIDINQAANLPVEFQWKPEGFTGTPQVSLVLKVSPSSDDEVVIPIGANSGTFQVTDRQIQTALSELGVDAGETQKLYWNIRNQSDNEDLDITPVEFTVVGLAKTGMLLSPAAGTTLDLNLPANDPAVFTWDQIGLSQKSNVSLVFKTSLSSSTEVSVNVGANTGSGSIAALDLQIALIQLGVTAGATQTVYWNVRNQSNQADISAVAQAVSITAMANLLIDVRGDQTIIYPAVEIAYADATSAVWTTQGLRTTRFPDGTEMGADDPTKWWHVAGRPPYPAGGNTLVHLESYPSGLTYPAAFDGYMGYLYHNDSYKKFTPPPGWHLPTLAEWQKLVDAAAASPGGLAVLCADNVWNTPLADVSQLNAWGMNIFAWGFSTGSNLYLAYPSSAEKVAAFWYDGASAWKPLLFNGTTTLNADWAEGATFRFVKD